MHRIIIFANGELPDLEKARLLLRPNDFILCADGGTRHALALGVKPNLILGDMDSVDKEMLKKFQQEDVEIELFPRDKDETDLELALNKAVELNPDEIIIAAALGGRIDQTLANIALISNTQYAIRNIRLDDGVEKIFFVANQAQVEGRIGDLVSLIPWGEPVHGVQTENFKWRLDGETLYPDKSRGISNEMTDDTASIKIESGLLLVVHTRNS
ncbi:MAG: thiamine diphosphokinase [Anaerolineales bacterium]|nr:MAG: thiamine diphosphokinase [Anaerolineales bacterium]